MTTANHTKPNWRPLEQAVLAAGLPIDACDEFMWMCEEPRSIHQYKHRSTRKYAWLAEHPPTDSGVFQDPVYQVLRATGTTRLY